MDRNLDIDMNVLKKWVANAVLSLIEDHEFDMLSVPKLGEAVKACSIDWFYFPVRNMEISTDKAMNA